MLERRVRGHQIKFAVAHAPVVLAPRHFVRVGAEIRTGDVMVDADFRAAQPAKETLGLIGAGVAVRIRQRMIDPLRLDSARATDPNERLRRRERAAVRHALTDRRNRCIFGRRDERKRLAVALAHDDDDVALAGLIARQATIAAVLFPIGRFDVAAKIAAVDFDLAASLLVGRPQRQRLRGA